jgi:hypothetical protein
VQAAAAVALKQGQTVVVELAGAATRLKTVELTLVVELAAVMAVPVVSEALAWSSSRCLTTSSQHSLVA